MMLFRRFHPLAWLKGMARAVINRPRRRTSRRYLLRYFLGAEPYSVLLVSAFSAEEARAIGEALCKEGKVIGCADDGSHPVEVRPVPGVFLAYVLDWEPRPKEAEANDIPF
jgi:hypothetical protein